MSGRRETFGARLVRTLAATPDGLTLEGLRRALIRTGRPFNRSSLAPTLTALRRRGLVHRDAGLWKAGAPTLRDQDATRLTRMAETPDIPINLRMDAPRAMGNGRRLSLGRIHESYDGQRYRDEPAVPKREPRIGSAPPDWTIDGGGSSLGGLW